MFDKASLLLRNALEADEFDDSLKYEDEEFDSNYYPQHVVTTINQWTRNLRRGDRWVDIGCGSGESMGIFPKITDIVEPNPKRYSRACDRNVGRFPKVNAYQGYAEGLISDLGPANFQPSSYKCVTYLRGFFQCQSDYLALININLILKRRGKFIFDVPTEKDPPPICGRGFVLKTLSSVTLKHFGFRVVSTTHFGRTEGLTLILAEKVADFSAATYNRPQLVRVGEFAMSDYSLYQVINAGSWNYWVGPAFRNKAKPYREGGATYLKLRSSVKVPYYLL